MQLSLEQATALLGKTRRQVLYMIEHKRLPAQKVGGRWVIERDDLHIDADIQQRASQQQVRFQAVIEEALLPSKGGATPCAISKPCSSPWPSTSSTWPALGSVSTATTLERINMTPQTFPPGWEAKRVRQVLQHYEEQTEDEAVTEDEAAHEASSQTVMAVPNVFVAAVRALIAGHHIRCKTAWRGSPKGCTLSLRYAWQSPQVVLPTGGSCVMHGKTAHGRG